MLCIQLIISNCYILFNIIIITVLAVETFFNMENFNSNKEKEREREISNFHSLYLSQLVIVRRSSVTQNLYTELSRQREIFSLRRSANVPLGLIFAEYIYGWLRIYIYQNENRIVCVWSRRKFSFISDVRVFAWM